MHCPSCGHPNPPDAVRCHVCGERLPDVRPIPLPPPENAPPFSPQPKEPSEERPAGMIPIHNKSALTAYYCGVFSLIPGLGLLLGPVAFLAGLHGLRLSLADERRKGAAHAIAGLALGAFTFLATVAFTVVVGTFLLGILLVRRQ